MLFHLNVPDLLLPHVAAPDINYAEGSQDFESFSSQLTSNAICLVIDV